MGTGSGVNPSLTTYTNSNQLAKVQFKEPNRKAPTSFNLDRFKMYGDYLKASDFERTTTDDDDYQKHFLESSNSKLTKSKDGWVYLKLSNNYSAWGVYPKLKNKDRHEYVNSDLPLSEQGQQDLNTALQNDYYYFISPYDFSASRFDLNLSKGEVLTNENYFVGTYEELSNDSCSFVPNSSGYAQNMLNTVILALNTNYVESIEVEYYSTDDEFTAGHVFISQLVNLDKEYEGILLDGQTKTITVNRSANYTEEELVSMVSAKDLFGVDCEVVVEESDYVQLMQL